MGIFRGLIVLDLKKIEKKGIWSFFRNKRGLWKLCSFWWRGKKLLFLNKVVRWRSCGGRRWMRGRLCFGFICFRCFLGGSRFFFLKLI